ncbi:hypothetical protein VTJ49DRAFT_7606 [Mycothermus thermophilus]|uniref:BZIP domain-containing protein n=1 Tax=Humicola insolens TaxID=85995 RepID=A0ABR3VHF3_HUMIN
MHYTHGDLPILSAETCSGPGGLGSGVKSSSASSRGTDPASKKRARTQNTGTPERSGDEKKRARGRPRLETKDETAADRRRTQIRLAQRAYRDRKEHTIQTLEKKVQTLTSANEEMSNAFMQLHDFALSCGLLDRAPEFGRQLRETTERFLSLAREASHDDATASPNAASSNQNSGSSSTSQRVRALPSTPPGDAPTETSRSLSGAPTFGSARGLDTPASIPITLPEDNYLTNQQSHPLSPFTYDPPTHDSLVTTTTSFPLASDPAFTYPHPSVTTVTSTGTTTLPTLPSTSIPGFTVPSVAPNPFLYLPPPTTHSHLESTFGRRLQRFALERALTLLTMPSPPQNYMERVFGFCLLLESQETIVKRLRRTLARDSGQSLFYWAFPFYHLGGAGTHFTPAVGGLGGGELGDAGVGGVGGLGNNREGGAHAHGQVGVDMDVDMSVQHHNPYRIGNSSLLQIDKPTTPSLFSPGPFTPQITKVRDHNLDNDDMHMKVPGFGGEYFDCDEVEMYLYRRGVVIPPGSAVVCVEVGEEDLERWTFVKRRRPGVASTGRRGGGGDGADGVHQMASVEWRVRTVDPLGGGDLSPLSQSGTSAGGDDRTAGPGTSNLVDPALVVGGGSSSSSSGSDQGSVLPFGMMMSPSDGASRAVGHGEETAGTDVREQVKETRTTKVVIDVMTLVKKLTARAICLGRTPGFKQIDLDTAFWAAVEASLEDDAVWRA